MKLKTPLSYPSLRIVSKMRAPAGSHNNFIHLVSARSRGRTSSFVPPVGQRLFSSSSTHASPYLSQTPSTSSNAASILVLPSGQGDEGKCVGMLEDDIGQIVLFPTFPEPMKPIGRQSTPFVITEVPGKGKGMIATRDIEPGVTILTERPTIFLPAAISSPEPYDPSRAMDEVWGKLGTKDVQILQALANLSHKDEDQDEMRLGMLNTNAITLLFSKHPNRSYAAVCPQIARCNHSCASNSLYVFNEREFSVSLVASSFIPKNEEITLGYVSPTTHYHERQATLLRRYKFICNCSLCTLDPVQRQKSDDRRSKIDNWFSNPGNVKLAAIPIRDRRTSATDLRRIIANSEQFYKLCAAENMQGVVLYIIVERAAVSSALLGDRGAFRLWGGRGLELMRILGWSLEGKANMTEERWITTLANPQKEIKLWGVRR